MNRQRPAVAGTYRWHLDVCERKTSYLSRTVAANAAWIFNLLPGRRARVEPYRCPFCSDWHLRSKRGD